LPATQVPSGAVTPVDDQSSVITYTDAEAEAIANRLPSLEEQFRKHIPSETMLHGVGIDPTHLKSIDGYAGNCLNVIVYELSKSYQLLVDNNLCEADRVLVEKKP
jgi:hypothetical protein